VEGARKRLAGGRRPRQSTRSAIARRLTRGG
jgi:hypothetical protein